MTSSIRIRNILSSVNPLAIHRRKVLRKQLTNNEISFFTPNCIGGILFHDLGLRFMSPTVNLMMYQTDFVKFVTNMDAYLSEELCFYKHPDFQFPCAKITNEKLSDISIHFTHYLSESDAKSKWESRKARINKDNIFVLVLERDGLSENEIRSLANLKIRGLVVFTAHEYKDIPYCVYLKNYSSNGEVSGIHSRSWIDDSREYEKYFDFVKWFNEANGGNYDVSTFVKH